MAKTGARATVFNLAAFPGLEGNTMSYLGAPRRSAAPAIDMVAVIMMPVEADRADAMRIAFDRPQTSSWILQA